jgi:hypothetical protein
MKKIISMLTTLEEINAKLQERFTTMEESNSELRKRLKAAEESNAQLQQSHEQLEATLVATMEAVLGVGEIMGARFLASLCLTYRIVLR